MLDYNESDDRKQRKAERKARNAVTEKASKLMRILSPHRHELRGDVYGRNDLHKLATDAAYNKDAWPVYKPSPLIQGDQNPIDTFYIPMIDKMCETYFAHAFKKHNYNDYDDIKKLPQFDISEIVENPYSLTDTEFKMAENDRQIAEQYGPEIFLPCIPEYVIKLNKNHMIYVKLIKNTDTLSTIQFDDFITKQRKLSYVSRLVITASYHDNGIEWDAQEYTTYEDFLIRDIDDMDWSDKEKQLWFDTFGVYPFDSPAIVSVPIALNDDVVDENNDIDMNKMYKKPFVIYRKEDVDWIIRESKRITPIPAEILASGDSVITGQKITNINDAYPKCLTAMALVNLQFIKSGKNAVNPDESSPIIRIGDMTIRTKTPIRTSITI